MDTNGHELIFKEEVYEIVGCAMEVLNYLKITGLQVGIILNFKQATLEWKRVVL